MKAQLNAFYETFYDLLGESAGEWASGSGEVVADGHAEQHALQENVYAELWKFAFIIAPLVSASPACKYVRSAWAFQWRASLMKAYLATWDTKQEPIEGASQRLHEVHAPKHTPLTRKAARSSHPHPCRTRSALRAGLTAASSLCWMPASRSSCSRPSS